MAERFLNSVQASQLLGVNPDTMRRYAREGKIRALRLGKDWKIPESALSDLAKGGVLAKGGKPIASTPAKAGGNPLAAALALSDKLTPEITAGASGGTFNAADELNTIREERDRDLSGV
jgi:excisionase family DNA binding protein